MTAGTDAVCPRNVLISGLLGVIPRAREGSVSPRISEGLPPNRKGLKETKAK
jgi:hypothetical protein